MKYNDWRDKLRYWLPMAALVFGMESCEERMEIPAAMPGEGMPVEVPLSFGFADEEDGYTISGSAGTRAGEDGEGGAFSARLLPAAKTRTGEATHPDALYQFYLMQYDRSDNLMGSVQYKETVPIGANFSTASTSVTLTQATDCQLVVIVRGQGNTTPAISGNLANVQKLVMDATLFKQTIPTSGLTQADINKMPYILHLPHVNVTADGKLQSMDGAYDARLLLKRLAVRLKVTWKMDDALTTGEQPYALKEVKLCQVPSAFRLLPAQTDTEWGKTYPDEVAEYVDYYRLTDAADLAAGEKTVWIPANVRGTSAKASSAYYRTKGNAPTAASYVELVVDNTEKKERLYYRAYLGGRESTDFNLYENKDYNWDVHITSTNYQSDGRIQLLDQTPVLSTNLVETSNCFMMKPGTNICFNPYKHEAGTGGWNDRLVSGGVISADKEIASVKVLWQTKDAGTSGDLVLGYVIDNNHHENLVNVSDIGDKDKALVHVKVPVTQGGNAVIEAKNSAGTTVWSWHIWVSDYVPVGLDATGIADDGTRTAAIKAAQGATQGGVVHAYDGYAWVDPGGDYYKKVIMDRNLGATRNTYSLTNSLDAARAYGMLYQWGRKDPIPGSLDGTNREIDVLYNGYGEVATLGKNGSATLDYTIRNPKSFSPNLYLGADSWNASGAKTIYDPCPAGWKVPLMTAADKNNIFKGFAMGTNSKGLGAGQWFSDKIPLSEAYFAVSNGLLYKDEVWFPLFRLRESGSGNLRDPWVDGKFRENYLPSFTMWGATASGDMGYYVEFKIEVMAAPTAAVSGKPYGFGVRCVQK